MSPFFNKPFRRRLIAERAYAVIEDHVGVTQIREIRNVKLWAKQIMFWRTHLDVFIQSYFGIKLKDTQQVVARQFANADT